MEIKIETGGQRLDKALSDLTELSRSLANEQIKAGQVLVNGQAKKAKYTVQEGISSPTMCQNQRFWSMWLRICHSRLSTKMRM